MQCAIDSSVYFYGILGSVVFSYITFDAVIGRLNNQAFRTIARLELELESARKQIEALTQTTEDDGSSTDTEHTE